MKLERFLIRKKVSLTFKRFTITMSVGNDMEKKPKYDKLRLLEQLPAISYIVEIGEVTRTTYISPQVETLLGFSTAEWMEDPDFWIKQIHPDDRERILKEVSDANQRGDSFSLEYRIIAHNKSIHWVENNASYIRNNQNNTMMVYGVMLDITIHKQSAVALEQTQELYSAVLNNTSDMIFMVNDKGIVTYLNLSARIHYDIEAYDSPLIHLSFFWCGDSIGKVAHAVTQVLNDKHPQSIDCGCGNNYYEISLNPIVQAGLPNQIVCVARDITARRKIEIALRDSEKRFKAILDHIQTGILIIDEETREIIDINPVALNLVGLKRNQVIGKVCHDFVCPKELGNCPIIDCGQVIDNSERVLLKHDLTELPILKSVTQVTLGGRPCLLECFIDISANKEHAEALRQYRDQLEVLVDERTRDLSKAYQELRSLDEMKTNLLANVSHELRSPLVSVRGYTELIAMEKSGPINDKQRRQLRISLRNVDRLLGLIDNLLHFSLNDNQGKPLIFTNFDLREVAQEAVIVSKPAAALNHITIHSEIPEQSFIIAGDRDKLHRVFTNLLDNAIKFTPRDNNIILHLEPLGEEMVACTVTDAGVGIPAAELDKIFERFYQTDASSTRKHSGAGIGLSVCQDIVKLHDGEIWASSPPTGGATITFTLPLLQDID